LEEEAAAGGSEEEAAAEGSEEEAAAEDSAVGEQNIVPADLAEVSGAERVSAAQAPREQMVAGWAAPVLPDRVAAREGAESDQADRVGSATGAPVP